MEAIGSFIFAVILVMYGSAPMLATLAIPWAMLGLLVYLTLRVCHVMITAQAYYLLFCYTTGVLYLLIVLVMSIQLMRCFVHWDYDNSSDEDDDCVTS